MDGLFKLLGNEAAGGGSDIKKIHKAVDKLIIITQALWEIIAESHGLSEEYIAAKVREIDMRDGAIDGRVKRPIRVCASCGKVLPLDRDACIYCGAQNKGVELFQTIGIEPSEYLAQGIF
jgi:hypothetical protein